MNTNTYTPSKELLSAVFNTTVKNIELDRGQTEVKIYRENTSCLGTYNIYELAHKCKEWAWLQEYRLISGKFKNKRAEAIEAAAMRIKRESVIENL